MNEPLALHTAARRYCRARHDEWRSEYQTLGLRLARAGKGAWVTDDVTAEELEVYPRFLVLAAILREIETLDPDDLPSLNELRMLLRRIGDEATDQFVAHPMNELVKSAMGDERQLFVRHITSLKAHDLANVKPLPYLRVFSEVETKDLWTALKTRWDVEGYWYPLMKGEPPTHVLPFHTDYFDQQKKDLLKRLLGERGIKRLRTLRWSIGFEIELESFEPSYEWSLGSRTLYGAGDEGFWTNAECDFLVYASHECSITIAGEWLVRAFERVVPVCRDSTFLGEISTEDLRGRW